MGKRKLTNLKSYLEFWEQGHRRMIYSIAKVETGKCTFFFDILKPGVYFWHFYTDFAINISDICCDYEEVTIHVEKSHDAIEIIGELIIPHPGGITISCKVDALSEKNIIELIKQEYSNRIAHIELLLQSERELQADVTCKEAHIEQLLQSERDLLAENAKKSEQIKKLRFDLGYQTSVADNLRRSEAELCKELEEAYREINRLQYELGNRT